jgi:hypothetical protein
MVTSDDAAHSRRHFSGSATPVRGAPDQEHGERPWRWLSRVNCLRVLDELAVLEQRHGDAWWEGQVMVALAGCHQLWTFDPVAATLTVLLGTADEGLPDDGPGEAFFAQPFTLRVRFSPPEGQHVDRRFGEPTSLTVTALDGFLPAGAGTAPGLERELRLDGSGLARVDAVAAACDGDGVFAACHRYRREWVVDVLVRTAAATEVVLDLRGRVAGAPSYGLS